ncbi:hypothetical protein M8312_13440 [Sphingomonas sp. KRR8]|uniref:hypothetical protein n=1 Tax=Sphingomonas sp. KRR8 TaxID=2942996 RepID=UPI00202160D4|nr:hypothetical protein [Sphingomonas sp. KRR8]URD60761.1 hypothetical protein M8312_13440 [Sphingomonas sp. KRR8]
MDINYLFKRQQIETSRANSAASQKAREAHQRLAVLYERQIELATSGTVTFPPRRFPTSALTEQ